MVRSNIAYEHLKKRCPSLKTITISDTVPNPKSDKVDLLTYSEHLDDFEKLDFFEVEDKADNRIQLLYKHKGKEVSLIATNDMNYFKNVKQQQENLFILNAYPLLLAQVIMLRKSGVNTREAWQKVLQTSTPIDDVLVLSSAKLRSLARKCQKEIETIIDNVVKLPAVGV